MHPEQDMMVNAGESCGPFRPNAVVLVTLNAPREKFWGAILGLSTSGLSIRGIELNSLEDFAAQVRAGEQVSAAAVFFPMHRIERIEVDARNGDIPSIAERFASKTGREFTSLLSAADGERG